MLSKSGDVTQVAYREAGNGVVLGRWWGEGGAQTWQGQWEEAGDSGRHWQPGGFVPPSFSPGSRLTPDGPAPPAHLSALLTGRHWLVCQSRAPGAVGHWNGATWSHRARLGPRPS